MTEDKQLVQLIAELRQLCREQQSGMVFLKTNENQLAQLSLDSGDIVYLFFKKLRGEDALQALRQIKTGSLVFKPGPISTARLEMPTTDKILDYLQNDGGQQSFDSVVDTTATRPNGSSALLEQYKSILLEELTELIGPMAVIVCHERLQAAHDLDAALDSLSSALPDASQAIHFKNSVLRRVAG